MADSGRIFRWGRILFRYLINLNYRYIPTMISSYEKMFLFALYALPDESCT